MKAWGTIACFLSVFSTQLSTRVGDKALLSTGADEPLYSSEEQYVVVLSWKWRGRKVVRKGSRPSQFSTSSSPQKCIEKLCPTTSLSPPLIRWLVHAADSLTHYWASIPRGLCFASTTQTIPRQPTTHASNTETDILNPLSPLPHLSLPSTLCFFFPLKLIEKEARWEDRRVVKEEDKRRKDWTEGLGRGEKKWN